MRIQEIVAEMISQVPELRKQVQEAQVLAEQKREELASFRSSMWFWERWFKNLAPKKTETYQQILHESSRSQREFEETRAKLENLLVSLQAQIVTHLRNTSPEFRENEERLVQVDNCYTAVVNLENAVRQLIDSVQSSKSMEEIELLFKSSPIGAVTHFQQQEIMDSVPKINEFISQMEKALNAYNGTDATISPIHIDLSIWSDLAMEGFLIIDFTSMEIIEQLSTLEAQLNKLLSETKKIRTAIEKERTTLYNYRNNQVESFKASCTKA